MLTRSDDGSWTVPTVPVRKRAWGLALALLTFGLLPGCVSDSTDAAANPQASPSADGPSAASSTTPNGVVQRRVGAMRLEDVPTIPSAIVERMRQYANTRSAGFIDWLPPAPGGGGEGLLIATRFGETTQLHTLLRPGAARAQMTFFAEPVRGASVRPGGVPDLLFRKDVGGSEFYQLFLHDAETGRFRMLSDGKSRNGGAIWSNDGDRFAYFTTRRNGVDWDVHIGTPDGEDRPVLQMPGVWTPEDWSFDDRALLVSRYVSINEGYLHVLDLGTGELQEILPVSDRDGEKVAIGAAEFDRDGRGVFFTSDYQSDFTRLLYADLQTGTVRPLTADVRWNISSFAVSPNGIFYAFVANEEGYGRLVVRRKSDHSRVALPLLPKGRLRGLGFSPDGRRLGFTISRPTAPSDAYSLDLDARELTRWTTSETGGLSEAAFVEPTLVRFESFDGLSVPAFVYRPRPPADVRGYPVLIDIHGGPESQARPSFSSQRQFLVNELGIAVVVPNVRGSSGYGKRYLQLDNGYRREDSVKDIGALLDWIATQPDLDAARVAVTGGSYGGYMTLAALIHYPDRLVAGAERVGISNFVTFLTNTQDYRRALRRQEYGDESDPAMRAFLEKISPTNNVARLNRPLLIGQGLNDPRVPASESEQMVRRVRDNGSRVWYLLAENEGHGFSKRQNRDLYNAAAALFFQRYLVGEEASLAPDAP